MPRSRIALATSSTVVAPDRPKLTSWRRCTVAIERSALCRACRSEVSNAMRSSSARRRSSMSIATPVAPMTVPVSVEHRFAATLDPVHGAVGPQSTRWSKRNARRVAIACCTVSCARPRSSGCRSCWYASYVSRDVERARRRRRGRARRPSRRCWCAGPRTTCPSGRPSSASRRRRARSSSGCGVHERALAPVPGRRRARSRRRRRRRRS